ncbi:hypothetical protein [Saccharopolyspora tripterygii]
MSNDNATTLIHPNTAELRMQPTEDLIRIHRKERLAEAERQRAVRAHSAGRRWRAIARYAMRRAEAAERR